MHYSKGVTSLYNLISTIKYFLTTAPAEITIERAQKYVQARKHKDHEIPINYVTSTLRSYTL